MIRDYFDGDRNSQSQGCTHFPTAMIASDLSQWTDPGVANEAVTQVEVWPLTKLWFNNCLRFPTISLCAKAKGLARLWPRTSLT